MGRVRAPFRPALMIATLACADLLALTIAVLGGFAGWSAINPAIPILHPGMPMAIGFCLLVFVFLGLYPGIGMTAVEYFRRATRGIVLVYLLLTGSMFLVKDWRDNSRGALFLSCLLSLALVPLVRWSALHVFAGRSWWGAPVIVVGAGETGRMVIRNLRQHPNLGYRAAVCVDDDPSKRGACDGVPVLGALMDAAALAAAHRIRYAIVALPGLKRQALLHHLQHWSAVFSNIVIVPDLFGVASLWVEPRDLNGVLGLELRQNLLNPFNRWLKRAIDVCGALAGLALAAPLLAAAALWIRRISPGPAFYPQEREGKDGRPIRIFKLRTMYANAEEMLRRHLEENPAARAEWRRHYKLKDDPRILPRVGRLLRQTSVDELPQLWNVLKGEMTLVGPRPFPAYHVERFDPHFRALRAQVLPGLTGYWQISARSDADLAAQAALDSYYIRNWSLWLDIYIVICTVRTVLQRKGAY